MRVERESDFETAVEYAISSGNQLDVSFRSRLEKEMGWDREGGWCGVGGGESACVREGEHQRNRGRARKSETVRSM